MKTIIDFFKAKEKGNKITMVSTYDYWSAKLCEEVGIDCILVGDSLGMVIQGLKTTLPVNIDEMIYHGKAVKRGAPNTFVVVDMPFLSYQISEEEALRNAGRILKETGADAVKIEGGEEVSNIIKRLVSSGIPVMAHLGLTPQYVLTLGGYKVQGKTEEEGKRILNNAKLLEENGAFSLVLEAIPEPLAKEITQNLKIATIGIGAGRYTDGQVLVFHDLLGFIDKTPKFVKKYLDGRDLMKNSLSEFINEVKTGKFPSEENIYF